MLALRLSLQIGKKSGQEKQAGYGKKSLHKLFYFAVRVQHFYAAVPAQDIIEIEVTILDVAVIDDLVIFINHANIFGINFLADVFVNCRFKIIYRISSKQIIDIIAVGPRKTIYEETYRIIKKETELQS